MATVNLGAIKFNWKGAYNNSTAYAVDDVVSSSGSSYVCILASQGNAVSNGTYWNIMSSAGTNGTDVGTTLTTQGDILYRDGSGLQRLGAGTSGQALLTGGSGANPSWGDAGGGKIGQVIYGSTTSAYNSNSTSYTDTSLTATITPSATSSKVVVLVTQAGDFVNGDANGTNRVSYLALFRGSTEIAGQKQRCAYQFGGYNVPISFSFSVLDAPSTVSATTYKTMAKIDNATEQHINFGYGTSRSQIILMEVLA